MQGIEEENLGLSVTLLRLETPPHAYVASLFFFFFFLNFQPSKISHVCGANAKACARGWGAATPSLVRDYVMMESYTTSSEGRYFQEYVHRREMYYTAH